MISLWLYEGYYGGFAYRILIGIEETGTRYSLQ